METVGNVNIYDVTASDRRRLSRLRAAAWASPFVLSLIPAVIAVLTFLLLATTPPLAATILFFGFVFAFAGLLVGAGFSAYFVHRRNTLLRELREMIAADGIRADEVEWFTRELKPSEKKALSSINARDPLLGDAYLETLASRLTATRVMRSTRQELQAMKRRRGRISSAGPESKKEFIATLDNDIRQLGQLGDQAKQMLAESESRLQMIEAAAVRGAGLTDAQFALGRLSERSKELPVALQDAIRLNETKREIERELKEGGE